MLKPNGLSSNLLAPERNSLSREWQMHRWQSAMNDQSPQAIAAHRANDDTLRLMLAMLLPPVEVYREYGLSKTFFLNVALTCLGIFPGVMHAVFVLLYRLRSSDV